METYLGTGTMLNVLIVELWDCDSHSCLQTILQNNPYYPFATCDVYKYIQCGIKTKGMKMYYENMLNEEKTALRFPSFKNRDGVQRHVATMADDQALGEWELHTIEDMRWNDKHQCPIKSWS
jgi:hypothetical protein